MIFNGCIVTDRLILRPFDKGDLKDVFALLSDEYIAERAGFRPFKSIEQAWGFIDRWQRSAFAITERCSDTVIGVIQTPHTGFRTADVGYWLASEYRGKGYMMEALEAIKAYLETLVPYVERGYYIPFCDHRCPPNVKEADYLYYLDLKERMFGLKG